MVTKDLVEKKELSDKCGVCGNTTDPALFCIDPSNDKRICEAPVCRNVYEVKNQTHLIHVQVEDGKYIVNGRTHDSLEQGLLRYKSGI